MLNKGPFIDEAVSVLSDILQRMEKHHYKKRSLFRRLRVSTFATANPSDPAAPQEHRLRALRE
jgi:pyruvate kinase